MGDFGDWETGGLENLEIGRLWGNYPITHSIPLCETANLHSTSDPLVPILYYCVKGSISILMFLMLFDDPYIFAQQALRVELHVWSYRSSYQLRTCPSRR